eukprot:1299592-Alexandrium_andersonii.AAC.1
MARGGMLECPNVGEHLRVLAATPRMTSIVLWRARLCKSVLYLGGQGGGASSSFCTSERTSRAGPGPQRRGHSRCPCRFPVLRRAGRCGVEGPGSA